MHRQQVHRQSIPLTQQPLAILPAPAKYLVGVYCEALTVAHSHRVLKRPKTFPSLRQSSRNTMPQLIPHPMLELKHARRVMKTFTTILRRHLISAKGKLNEWTAAPQRGPIF